MADVRIKYKVDKGELVLARRELEKIKKELGLIDDESKKTNTGLGSMSKGLKGVAVGIAAAFTVDRLIDFGRRVIEVTAEFQRLQAVLTTTLGSRSQAQAAFTRIQQFASQTPFQVSALTDSFVRLANQGFVPTNDELRKLGDLASSTGKQFDQLTEALIDAQVGEFERLKEFGIRASKEGENVTFAFKGVETQVAFTNEAIRDYILSLGELNGVSGSMEAVSQTLGGQISNLEDSFDALFFAIGSASGGIIKDVLTALGEAVEFATRLVNLANGVSNVAANELNKLNEEFGDLKTAEDYGEAIREIERRLKETNQALENNITQQDLLKSSQSDATTSTQNLAGTIDEAALAAKAASDDYADLAKELGATGEATEDTEGAAGKTIKTFSELSSEIDLQAVQVKVLADFLEQLREKLAQVGREQQALADVQRKTFKDEIDFEDRAKKQREERIEQFTSLTDANADLNRELIKTNEITERNADRQKELTEEELKQIAKKEAAYQALNEAIDILGNEIFERQQERLDLELERFNQEQEARIEKLEAERDRQLEIAGSSAEARKAIEQKFARDKAAIDEELAAKEREIRIRQARADKAQALFNIAIDTARGIVNALAALRPELAVAIGVVGGIQAAAVASRPIPKFAKGVLNLQGGTPGRDSVPSLLMPGESVMTTAETRDFMPTLKAIRENRIDPALLNAVAEGKGGGSRAEIHNNIIEVPRDNVVWDEDGFSLYMHRKSSTVQKKGIRYKC